MSAGVTKADVTDGGVIVVGAGQAAAQLCLSLRAGGFRDRIRVIGAERFAPYQRPPLSKKFLTERRPPETLLLRPETLWRDQGVELVLDTTVKELDLARRTIATVDPRGRSQELTFATLVLATGTRARALTAPGAGLAGIFSLRSIDDVHRLRPALDAAGRIVIVGGGYIGLEVAAIMRQESRDVMVLEAEDRLLKRVTGTEVSTFFETLHRERGVDLRLGARLAAIVGEDAVSGVQLADGTLLAADRSAGQRRSRPQRRARVPGRHPGRRAGPHLGARGLRGRGLHALPERPLRPANSPGKRAERHRSGQDRRRRHHGCAAAL
jgi:3-phenylpropionate/trans-cinnamate dioxygenase ferredoxin reductase subunit